MFQDFESKYTPTQLDDFVFNSETSKMVIEDVVGGLLPFPGMGKMAYCFMAALELVRVRLLRCYQA